MKTSVIVPIVRPEKAKIAIEMAEKNAGIPREDFEILYFVDIQQIGAPRMVKALTAVSQFETVAFIGDDTEPQKDWLFHAQEAMSCLPGSWGLVGFNDQTGRDNLATHWLGHKKLLERIGGEFFHTGYFHTCCDVELTERAKRLGRYKYCNESVVLSPDHPLLQGQVVRVEDLKDEHYRRAYDTDRVNHDRNLLMTRSSNNWR